MGEAESSAGARLVLSPQQTSGGQEGGSVLDLGHPILMPQSKDHWDTLLPTSLYPPLKSLLCQLSDAHHFLSRG